MKYFLCLLCVQLVVFFATSSDLSIDIDALLSSNDIISSPTLSKEVIIEGLTKLVEPFASSYPYGIQYPREVQIGEDGHAVISSSSETDTDHRSLAGIDPSQLAKLIAFLTTHEGLSAGCSNKLCSYFEYALSCKAIGFNLKKICAKYFLGRLLGCPIFPSPPDFYNAPSICANEVATVAKSLAGGLNPKNKSSLIGGFLLGDFSVACNRTCYQNVLGAANDFYTTCRSELNTHSKNYTVATQLQNFNAFQSQVCVFNPQGQNCFSSLYQLTTQGGVPVDIFNQQCNYLNDLPTNNVILGLICGKLGAFGCCYANQVAMLAQDQSNASKLVLLPPCLLNYMTRACPGISNTKPCTSGSVGNVSIIEGTVKITGSSPRLPNMYSQDSTLLLQGTLIGALAGAGFSNEELLNWGLNPNKPFTVQIMNYTYFNGSGAALTGAGPGQVYSLNGLDYTQAASGTFVFNFFINNLNSSQATSLYKAMKSTAYARTFGFSLMGNPAAASVSFAQSPLQYAAEPFHTVHNGGSRVSQSIGYTLCSVFLISLIAIGWSN